MWSVGRTEDWHPAAHDPFVSLEGALARINAVHNRSHPKNLSPLLSFSGAVSAGRIVIGSREWHLFFFTFK